MKRLFDTVAAATGLIVLAPVLVVLSVIVACHDGFPVFFSQKRIGRFGRPFQLLKFRSMSSDLSGSQVTAGSDARVTRVGKVLRRFKLDELPQLWNVLKGDMSLIGPRPEVPAFVDFRNPVWKFVVSIRPGITDLASLVYRNEEGILENRDNPEIYYREVVLPAKLELNVYYIQNRSLLLDLKLLLWTVHYSLFPAGFDAERVKQIFDLRPIIQTADSADIS